MAGKRKKRHQPKVKPTSKPARPLKARLLNALYAYGILFLLLAGFLFVIQVIMGPGIQRSALKQWTHETDIAADRYVIPFQLDDTTAQSGRTLCWPATTGVSSTSRMPCDWPSATIATHRDGTMCENMCCG